MTDIVDGFQIDWVTIRDCDKDLILWSSNIDLSDGSSEHKVSVPEAVRKCKLVARDICFSTKNKISNLKLKQKVMFKKRCLEEWQFEFGAVDEQTTNVWRNMMHAAPEMQMMPSSKILSGNVVIESTFFDDTEVIVESKVRVYYDNEGDIT